LKKLLYLLLLIPAIYACKPDDEIITTNPQDGLTFDTDTILFDTVFTTIKTATRRLRVYNTNKNAINLSNVRFGMGAASPFSAIVNGQAGEKVQDLMIRGGDSILVIIEAKIDAANLDNPFVIEDSLIFNANNGQENQVQVRAWGQDAVFLNDTILDCAVVWDSTRPYVIYNRVVVPESCQLTILEGTSIYANNTAVMFVAGTLNIAGTADHPVVFRGMRREKRYEDVPGQWLGIVLLDGSTNNVINHAIIKNAFRAVQVGELEKKQGTDLRLSNTTIMNMSESGLFCLNPNDLLVYNCVIGNSAKSNVAAYNGGSYYFYHNTFTFSNTLGFIRNTPSVLFANIFETEQQLSFPITLSFINNIVSGRAPKEFDIFLRGDSDSEPIIELAHNYLKTSDNTWAVNNNIVSQQEINLKAPAKYDFRLDTAKVSPAKNAGVMLNYPFLNTDLDGKQRPVGPAPDIGAYEQQE
jgi:hypothetical protein